MKLNKNQEDEIKILLQKSRINLLLKFPFFGILSLKLILKQDYTINTAGTDGIYLFYNPKFINKIKKIEYINWLIVHEVMHCALKHIFRRENKDKIRWNMACDYAIHSILNEYVKENHVSELKMIEGALYDKKYNNMSADEIYNILPQSNEYSILDDHSYWGKGSNTDSNNKESFDDLENQWTDNIISAAKSIENSQQAGNIPGYFKRYIDKITNPIKDWRILLREIIEPEINDYTFMLPDYRIDYDIFGCFLPSFNDNTENVNVKKVMFWVDTSGSIMNDELNRIYSEVAGAVQQFDKFEGYLGFFDHEAYKPTLFNDINSLMDIKPIGGGGTNFNAPFEYINENNEFRDIKFIIILTDGYCNFPDESITDIPTIWLITNKQITAPWGTSIYLPINERN